jgi:predicted transcriptional regulator of viral defense system
MPNRSAKVARVAGRQCGRITWAQLMVLGIAHATVADWVQEGYLHHVRPRVYAVGHRAASVEASLWEAVLYAGPGAMLSHATALWWHGLIDKQPRPIQVSTPRRCRSLSGIRVYGRRTCARILHNGVPTTSVEQALLDYAASAPIERLRHALANADYHEVLDLGALRVIAGSGRAGSAKLRKALERHEPKLAYTRSHLERTFLGLCERAGIPMPEVNVWVAGVLVDAVWRDRRLVVELDGRNNHSSWAQIQDDRSKELRLRAVGFVVVRYGTRQVEEELSLVAADLAAQYAASWPARSA